jgi:hypothetical protein
MGVIWPEITGFSPITFYALFFMQVKKNAKKRLKTVKKGAKNA